MAEQANSSGLEDFRRRPGRTGLISLILVAGIGLLVASCNSGDQTNGSGTAIPSPSPASAARQGAPPRIVPAGPVALSQGVLDTTVQTLDGNSLKLSDFDNKVVVVNIWATWCGPCRQEMPDLVKLNQEYKSRGLVVLGLATTYNERQGLDYVKNFIRANGITYKIIWDDGTLDQPLREAVNARPVIPQSFVISRDGRIVKHFSGFNALSTPTLMRQAVEEALNDKGKA